MLIFFIFLEFILKIIYFSFIVIKITIKACTHYELNGKTIDYLPFEDNEGLTPIYKEMKGWDMDLMQLESLAEAPKEVHDYIDYLEKELETPISIVSVGPDRKQTFFR